MIQVSPAFSTANAILAKYAIYRLEIATYGRIFVSIPSIGDQLVEPLAAGEFPWIEQGGIADLTITVSDLDGGAELSNLSVTVQDHLGKITADLPWSLLEGRAVTLKTGFPGMARSDYATLFSGVVDTIVGANDNNSYTFNCTDNSQVLAKVIFTVGDSGRPTDSSNPRTINGHPIDILIEVLKDEIGIDPSQINLAKLYGYRDGPFAGMQYTFSIDTPPAAKDFIENELMKPLGGYHWIDSLGRFDFNFFYPNSVIPVFAGALIGGWADVTGALVTNPFLIGNSLTAKVPAGATQLLMGTNDAVFSDNTGAWQVSVNGASAVAVQGQSKPYSVTGGLNAAYFFNDSGSIAPTSVAVTAGTTVSIVHTSGSVSIGSGFPFVDGQGLPGSPSDPNAPGKYASPQVIFKVPVMNLTIDNTLQIPLAEQADLVNVVAFRFDKDSQGTFFAQPVEKYTKSIARFGEVGAGQLYGEQVIESAGMRSGLQGYFLAAFGARLIFLRYGLKNLQYQGVPHIWTTCVLEPGDIVNVTNRFVPDRATGVMGITNKLMEVMDRDYNFAEGTVTLKLLDASYLSSFGNFLITHDAQAAYASASADEKAKYMFLCNDSDQYSNADKSHVLG